MGTETDRLRAMRRAFAKLDPLTQQVFLAHRVEGLSYGETAERHGISAEAVERHVADALYELAREVDRAERPWWRFW
jgi:RNA polymerase sigma-70 factor (ECF subfamily)